jgi:F420-dependent methylenetetrahydromethanopterin dehydrogenase
MFKGTEYYHKGQPSCKCAIAVSAPTTTLNIKQPNVIRVIEFRESPDPFIIMDMVTLQKRTDVPIPAVVDARETRISEADDDQGIGYILME